VPRIGAAIDLMNHTHRRIVAVFGVSIFLVGAYIYWGNRKPTRPTNIPQDSTWVPLPKTYKWVHCWLDEKRQVNVCNVYQSDGSLWYTDDFLPFKTAGPIPVERMKISENFQGYTIQLEDGTILIRKAVYEREVELLERNEPSSKR
jgi:hypothetical protein